MGFGDMITFQAPERMRESCDLTTHPHRTDVSHDSAAWRAVRQRTGWFILVYRLAMDARPWKDDGVAG